MYNIIQRRFDQRFSKNNVFVRQKKIVKEEGQSKGCEKNYIKYNDNIHGYLRGVVCNRVCGLCERECVTQASTSGDDVGAGCV